MKWDFYLIITMRKLLLLISAAFTVNASAQSIVLKNNANSATITPNSVITITTAVNDVTAFTFDIMNNSGVQQSYNAKRYDITLNAGADAYFCFAGTCYGAATYSAGPLTLQAGESASQLSGSYQMLVADLSEGPVSGYSEVKYTFWNASNVNDSVQVTLKYNAVSGIVKQAGSVLKAEIFPVPSAGEVFLSLNTIRSASAQIVLCNAAGQVVSVKTKQLIAGDNTIELGGENLIPGVYTAKIKVDNVIQSRSFIIK